MESVRTIKRPMMERVIRRKGVNARREVRVEL
jgi:hypothetical protein